jgi:probable O-glycosylation ligase (exosortase A-associated)
MKDFLVIAIVAIMALAALRKPWIGVLLWVWVSIMNPHRYCYGFAYSAPVAMIAAVCTLIGLAATKDERASPFKNSAVTVFFVFMLWMTLSWLVGLDTAGDFEQWNKVMKIDVMVLVGLMVMHSKKHLMGLAWVAAGSLMLLGAKGGIFTVLSGGGERVWGPPGSFIEDNNEFGLALIMTIPLLRFLQMQLQSRWGRWLMTAVMLLCAAAALGTQSRGALLAISAMSVVLWWRGRNRVLGGILIGLTALALVSFMPDSWTKRMNTIETYQEDGSAQGRLAAWSAAAGIGLHYPTGVGFNQVRQDLFDRYSHNPQAGARAAHSIYFQILGNHGVIGLLLFVSIWLITFFQAGGLRKHAAAIPEAQWCADLGSMVQVCVIGYFVGGAFLSLAYFDLPYYVMMMVAIARVWVQSRGWERERPEPARWWTMPGLQTALKPT